MRIIPFKYFEMRCISIGGGVFNIHPLYLKNDLFFVVRRRYKSIYVNGMSLLDIIIIIIMLSWYLETATIAESYNHKLLLDISFFIMCLLFRECVSYLFARMLSGICRSKQ
jgi:hypothetical protein